MVKVLVLAALVAALTNSVGWSAPKFREDGSELKSEEISGYHVYWGFGHDYQDEIRLRPDQLRVTLPIKTTRMVCAVVTTLDLQGREGKYSEPLCFNGDVPNKPAGIKIIMGSL